MKLPVQTRPPAGNSPWWWGLIHGCVPKPTPLDVSAADGRLSAVNNRYSQTDRDSARSSTPSTQRKLWMNSHVDDFMQSPVWNLGLWICRLMQPSVLTVSSGAAAHHHHLPPQSPSVLLRPAAISPWRIMERPVRDECTWAALFLYSCYSCTHTLLKAKRRPWEVIVAKSVFTLISHSLRGWKKWKRERNRGIFNQHAADDKVWWGKEGD